MSATKIISSSHSAFSQRQFNADVYHNSINIATEATPHSQSNDISHVKGYFCGKFYRPSREILALKSFRVVTCFMSLGARSQIFRAM